LKFNNDHKSEVPSAMVKGESKTTPVDYTEVVLTILEILFTPID
jgi:hypothetical protein